jgi:hypothetical protein
VNIDLVAGVKKKKREARNKAGREVKRGMKRKNLRSKDAVNQKIWRKVTQDK